MGSKLSPILALLTLTASFPLVEGMGHRKLYWRESYNESTTSDTKSTDIQSLLSSIDMEKYHHLEVLYDEEFTDVAVTLVAVFSSAPPGTRFHRYEEQSKILQQILKTSTKERFLLLVICSPDNMVRIFRTIKEKRLESHFIQWVLILFDANESKELISNLEGFIYEGNQVIVASKVTGRKFLLFAVYTDVRGFSKFQLRGGWQLEAKRNQNLLPSLLSEKPDVTPNMRGRNMTVTAVEVYPFIGFKRIRPDGTVEPTFGTDVMLLQSLSRKLNFTYRIVPSPDGTWGIPQENGSISGVVGMVARREASFAIGGNVMNAARETVIDYTTWYSQGYLKIFSRAPREKNGALAIVFTFSLEVWLCIIFSVVGVGTYLVLQAKLLTFRADVMKYGIQEYYFNVFRNLVVQCNLLDVKDWPERITFFSWYLFCLIVVALYAGMLTAVLAVPEFEEPVDSLTDLAKAVKQGFTLGVTRESSNEYIFRDATKGIYKEVWGLFNHEDRSKSFVASPSIGMKKILEEKFIFIWFETLGKNFAAGLGSYKFHISRESFFPQSFSYPVPPGAPYKETFSRLIMRIVEGGIMSKWEDDVFRRNSQTQSGNRRDFTAITLNHLQAAFILLIIGFLIAFGALTLEKVTVSCSR